MKGIIGKGAMERETVRQLFMQHYARMHRVARTLLLDAQESEDVCVDIFESLLRGETVLVPGMEEAYLMTSVRNRCLKRLRHEAIKEAPSPLDWGVPASLRLSPFGRVGEGLLYASPHVSSHSGSK